ncbi:SDR family oxidoreductase [Salmonirosea aquatica]|uniref:SDR family NAD(P)-dependent oxidoreductase n=1 Tax=Salmonirosea aquatica TaxID=2654236 RepID=A0A7C9G055_9BACT|nr:SDR family NAD(P)-dependent oxidoreductase [Cytophagaceae bacterium SJW1-29]
MNLSERTVLITGGGSGIGLQIAKLLSQRGNKVLIVGRDAQKLHQAAASSHNTIALPCDITDTGEVDKLVDEIGSHYPELSVLINNAGMAFKYTHSEDAQAFNKAKQEMDTNYFSLIRLTEKLLPTLKRHPEAAIVNVSSIVAFSPLSVLPTYSDSKAAVHSYTLALRHTLAKDTAVKVFELMPPTVNTEFSKEIGGQQHGMPAQEVATELIEGMENDMFEIYVGRTNSFRQLFLSDPQEAFNLLNQS